MSLLLVDAAACPWCNVSALLTDDHVRYEHAADCRWLAIRAEQQARRARLVRLAVERETMRPWALR